MKNLDPRRRRWMRVRIAMLGGLLGLAATLVLGAAWRVQVEQGELLRERAERQYLTARRLAPKRGTIFDRHGAELAVSVDVRSVHADPRRLASEGLSPRAVARRLATVLPIDAGRIGARLAKDRAFVWVARRVTPKQAAAVEAMGIPGVHLVSESRRFYPNRELAAHVLGFANVDGVGIEGLELALDEPLRGSGAAASAIEDNVGRVVFSQQLLEGNDALGHDVVLTLDRTLQRIAERELALALGTFEAKAGSVVVVDPSTGEILAMANAPTFNPNAPGRYPADARRNRAATDRFEPGSTVKPFTIAGALAARAVRPTQRIDCGEGRLELGDEVIHDTGRYGRLTPAEILAVSSNIGTARIAKRLGREGLFRTLRRFGFGEVTGLPLPGETRGKLRHYRRWYEMDAATISFGQGMSATATQLALATASLANGGRLMHPILVKRVVENRGATVRESLPRVRRRVVPRRVARLVGEMMTAVTGPGGTGEAASVDGYLVAGKTGTAQKADAGEAGYARDRWVSSFVGFVPAEAPRLAIAVVVDEPMIASGGGTVAGPVFRRIAAASLRHLGVPPASGGDVGTLARMAGASPERPDRAAAAADPVQPGTVPDFLGATARRAVVHARRAGLVPRLRGSGAVVSQRPAPGEPHGDGDEVLLELAPPRTPDRAPPASARAAAGPTPGGGAS